MILRQLALFVAISALVFPCLDKAKPLNVGDLAYAAACPSLSILLCSSSLAPRRMIGTLAARSTDGSDAFCVDGVGVTAFAFLIVVDLVTQFGVFVDTERRVFIPQQAAAGSCDPSRQVVVLDDLLHTTNAPALPVLRSVSIEHSEALERLPGEILSWCHWLTQTVAIDRLLRALASA